jgi:methionine biosynthesis protein MetW
VTIDELKYNALSDDPCQSHAMIVRLVSGSRTVLEVGAATGYLSEAIAKAGASVVAIEINPVAAAIARERGLDVRVGTAETVLRPDEQFDCVVLADVIEHVHDADSLLDAILRHLKPEGSMVISVPNVAHWTIRLQLLRGRFDYTQRGLMDETHVHFYTQASLQRLLARHGLVVEQRLCSLGPMTNKRFHHWRINWYQRRIGQKLVAAFPGLFGFQFVWRARPMNHRTS